MVRAMQGGCHWPLKAVGIPIGHVRPRSSVIEETPAYIIDQLKGPASYLAESPNATRLGLCSSLIELWSCRFRLSDRTFMGLLPDTQNCELRMRRECRERFPRYRLQKKPIVSGPDMHHGTWQGKRSRHSRCMRNPQFYASGKRLMNSSVGARFTMTWKRFPHNWHLVDGIYRSPSTGSFDFY